ncbi:MAG: tryptophan--tRNA ligase [Rickettsiales bacterium]|jgi:tryptophanyl-tRNA synthetase|nr:tryptophan--tRNA ligase [Rickettsiales bacterium]
MDTYEKSVEISDKIKKDLVRNPGAYRILTGDRPTGNLHLGHFFGSLQNRIKFQEAGIELFMLIADYQVLTDHDSCDKISQNTKEIIKDYVAAGFDFEKDNIFVFPHSQIPELNQLLAPFLTLVSMGELERNPTVKEEIQSAQIKSVNAGMMVYPAHQTADILSVNANVVPVGKDQLPHLELSRVIARRFNNKFCPNNPIFDEPNAILSETPKLLGLDGKQKMSKSRGNSLMLKATREEVAEAVKKAVTDSEKNITYDPENRPEISNLLFLCSLMSDEKPEKIAANIGNGGARALKDLLIETADAFLAPMRERRKNLTEEHVIKILRKGVERAREEARKTLDKVLDVMNMKIF